jgi:hypothetical protein
MTANIFCLSLFGPAFRARKGDLAVFLSVCGVQSTTGAERPHAGMWVCVTEASGEVKASGKFATDWALYRRAPAVI